MTAVYVENTSKFRNNCFIVKELIQKKAIGIIDETANEQTFFCAQCGLKYSLKDTNNLKETTIDALVLDWLRVTKHTQEINNDSWWWAVPTLRFLCGEPKYTCIYCEPGNDRKLSTLNGKLHHRLKLEIMITPIKILSQLFLIHIHAMEKEIRIIVQTCSCKPPKLKKTKKPTSKREEENIIRGMLMDDDHIWMDSQNVFTVLKRTNQSECIYCGKAFEGHCGDVLNYCGI